MDKKIKILFDTDIGADCDDAGALALAHRLCDLGEAELLAVTCCHTSPYVAGCIDAINTYYGRIVPVGVNYENPLWLDGSNYARNLCEEFPSRYPASVMESPDRPEDTLRLMRRILAQEEDHSVVLIATGPLSSLARLVMSGPDDISPLSGKELISKKILRTVIMGGRFFGTWPMPVVYHDNPESSLEIIAEYNISADVPASQTVCSQWQEELIFSSFEIGMYTVTMQEYTAKAPKDDPVCRAYALFESLPNVAYRGRFSWDHTAMLYGIRPDSGYYHLHPYGRIDVDDSGVTTWHEDSRFRHTYLLPRADYDFVRDVIDSLVLPQ